MTNESNYHEIVRNCNFFWQMHCNFRIVHFLKRVQRQLTLIEHKVEYLMKFLGCNTVVVSKYRSVLVSSETLILQTGFCVGFKLGLLRTKSNGFSYQVGFVLRCSSIFSETRCFAYLWQALKGRWGFLDT